MVGYPVQSVLSYVRTPLEPLIIDGTSDDEMADCDSAPVQGNVTSQPATDQGTEDLLASSPTLHELPPVQLPPIDWLFHIAGKAETQPQPSINQAMRDALNRQLVPEHVPDVHIDLEDIIAGPRARKRAGIEPEHLSQNAHHQAPQDPPQEPPHQPLDGAPQQFYYEAPNPDLQHAFQNRYHEAVYGAIVQHAHDKASRQHQAQNYAPQRAPLHDASQHVSDNVLSPIAQPRETSNALSSPQGQAIPHMSVSQRQGPAVPSQRRALAADQLLFLNVLTSYERIVFMPIGQTIGLTPHAALRLALMMGSEKMERIASTTPMPFCGYNAQNYLPVNGFVRRPAPERCDIRELMTFSALLTKFSYIEDIDDRLRQIYLHYPYERDIANLREYLQFPETKPMIGRADHLLVSHWFRRLREQARETVSKHLGLHNGECQLVEAILFDTNRLHLYGHLLPPFRPFRPAVSKDILQLNHLATVHLHSPNNDFKREAWGHIDYLLFNPSGIFMYPIMERFAARPIPLREASHALENYDTAEHACFRLRIMEWLRDIITA